MPNRIPTTSEALFSLLRADFTTQWRNRRSFILILLVPVVILMSWKSIIDKMGAPFALSSCITIGLTAVGLMGYSNSIARDRDKGVFQRLRVAPVPAWTIMISRFTVQAAMICLITLLVFVAGFYIDHISISAGGYILSSVMALVGGALYLGLGQMIVGLIKNPETVNSTTRLVYFVFILVGMLGEFGALGEQLQQIIRWSPYGTVKRLLSASMEPSGWNTETTYSLLATVLYALVFSVLGIKWFKWSSR
jgi:ABC-2 type transport system permease protein